DGPLVVGTQPEAEELDAAARAEPDFELLGPQKMRLRLEDQLASLQCRGVLAPEIRPQLLQRALEGHRVVHEDASLRRQVVEEGGEAALVEGGEHAADLRLDAAG